MIRQLSDHRHRSARQTTVVAWCEDFGRPVEEPQESVTPPEPLFTSAELEAARLQAWNEGYMAALGDSQVANLRRAADVFSDLLVQANRFHKRLDELVDRSAVALGAWLAEALSTILPSLSAGFAAARREAVATVLRDTLYKAARIEVSGGGAPTKSFATLEDVWCEVVHRSQMVPAAGDIAVVWPDALACFDSSRTWQQISEAILPVSAPSHDSNRETVLVLSPAENALDVR